MEEITTYFGDELMTIFLTKAHNKSQEFINQSKATKADMADNLKIQNEILKINAQEMLDAFELSDARNGEKD